MTTTIFESLMHILILTPLLIWAGKKNKPNNIKPIIYFVIVYVITNLLLTSGSNISLFHGQQWNWFGKGAVLLAGFFLIFIFPDFRKLSFCVTSKINWKETKPLIVVCSIYFLVRVGLYSTSTGVTQSIDPETTLYQATLPGLQEELIYRGILLGLLNSVFVTPNFKLLKVDFGIATIITSLLFGFAHGIIVDKNLVFNLNYFALLRAAFDGFLFALLTEKTKSIFPNVIFHNILNLIGQH